MTNPNIFISAKLDLHRFGAAWITGIEPDDKYGEMVVHARAEGGDTLTLSISYAAKVVVTA